MRRIILASHGMLAEGMKDSVTFIVGHSNNIYTISAYTKEDFSFEAEVKQIFESFNDGDEVIVITDIYGGSVNSITIQKINEVNVVSGYLIGGSSTSIQELKKIKEVVS